MGLPDPLLFFHIDMRTICSGLHERGPNHGQEFLFWLVDVELLRGVQRECKVHALHRSRAKRTTAVSSLLPDYG